MLATMAAMAVALVAPDRVAVMASDPGGRADELARATVQRLRADGWDAVAVATPPERIDLPAEQDRVAKRMGATRVLALDLASDRRRKSWGGELDAQYFPTWRVPGFDIQAMQDPMRLNPKSRDLGPDLPKATVRTPRYVQEQLQIDSRVMWRRVGESRFDLDRKIDSGAMTGWRADLSPRESEETVHREQHMQQVLLAQLANRTVDLIEMQ